MSRQPDGGSGGQGGDVVFKASGRISSLHDLRRAHFKGNNGKQGKGSQRFGADGAKKTFSVPLGTEIYQVKNSNRDQAKRGVSG